MRNESRWLARVRWNGRLAERPNKRRASTRCTRDPLPCLALRERPRSSYSACRGVSVPRYSLSGRDPPHPGSLPNHFLRP